MPKRIVDGEAIATSQKLRCVEPESFRIHYPYLLTEALANGTFEADPVAIWGRKYAVLMPSVRPEDVAAMLDAFEGADLLIRWTADGKIWGYWTGIEKDGRLPPKSIRTRYNCGPEPPNQDSVLSQSRPTQDNVLPGVGFGLELERIGLGMEKTSSPCNLDDELPDGFDEFWQAYPQEHRDADEMTQAIEVWKKVAPDADLQRKIMAILDADKKDGWIGSPVIFLVPFCRPANR